jgi:hypothetical protein
MNKKLVASAGLDEENIKKAQFSKTIDPAS